MVSEKTLKAIEYDKILLSLSNRAVLFDSKNQILSLQPASSLQQAKLSLIKTKEAYDLLYKYNASNVYFFDNVSDELKRADMGGTLINGELLKIAQNLKGARILKSSILSLKDESMVYIPEIASRLYTNQDFEEEIAKKIISEDEISDNASSTLASIRKNIRNLNASIRDKLNSYIRGSNRYLQDSVVTKRQDRYVIPVKSEYKSLVKGFVHDESSSGATVFIEPEQVMELNNQLKSAMIQEMNEIRRILFELSVKVASFSEMIRYNLENIIDIDISYAKAIYSYQNKCTYPILNDKGIVNIKKGRHPLIDSNKVVPIDVCFGKEYNFLLITGPNTGGKTVTLKLTGLFSLMASIGLYVPAQDSSEIAIYSNVFCDIGDEQSIEQSLSTFSSHVYNIINILSKTDNNSLVLFDELGAGTDPEEGSALALAIIEDLLQKNCYGIITTHYSRLKEFAAVSDKIENASMEFDNKTLKPRYKLNIGIPGSSNAIEIAKTLGLSDSITKKAESYISSSQIGFENVLKKAEESRKLYDEKLTELLNIEKLKDEEYKNIILEKEKITKEREKIANTSKIEIKRIVSQKLEDAEEIIDELKGILRKKDIEDKDIFRANELKNRLKNSKYLQYEEQDIPFEKLDEKQIKIGEMIFVKSLGSKAKIIDFKKDKNEVVVLIGSIKTLVKKEDLYKFIDYSKKDKEKNKKFTKGVQVSKHIDFSPKLEINIIGKTSLEAITEVGYFIDQAVVNGVDEIKIIHGVGEGILLKEDRNLLKKDKRILEFRRGNYGEGENGVTIAKLR